MQARLRINMWKIWSTRVFEIACGYQQTRGFGLMPGMQQVAFRASDRLTMKPVPLIRGVAMSARGRVSVAGLVARGRLVCKGAGRVLESRGQVRVTNVRSAAGAAAREE